MTDTQIDIHGTVLRAALAGLNDVVLITEAEPFDRPGPRIVYVNAAFERMTGYRSDEVIGLTPRILQGPRTNAAELARIHRALESWSAVRVCLTNYRKDGIPFDVEFEIVPVANEAGWYTHWVSVQRDVTARTLAELITRTAATFDELLAGAASEIAMFTGAASCSVCVRSSSLEPWIVRYHHSAGAAPVPEGWPRQIETAIAQTPAPAAVMPISLVDGVGCACAVPLNVGGELAIVVCRTERGAWPLADTLLPAVASRVAAASDRLRVQRDRTRLESELMQAHKLQAVGRLASGIAHDFNNLLTVITGNLEFMRERWRDARAVEPVELAEVLGAAERARGLVEHLLAFSHRRPMAAAPVDVRALVASTAALLQRTLGAEITIETSVAAEGELLIDGDAALLEQALLNLAFNARDAIESVAGGLADRRITLAARLVVLSDQEAARWAPLVAGACVEITVIDSGPGMTTDVKARAFEPFFTTKDVGEGTGLGLASVFGAVTNLRGAVRLEDALPHGSVVRMRFPRGASSASAEPAPATPLAAAPQRTLLFVEDDDAVRSVMKRMLQSAGYFVVEARNGQEALARVATMGDELAGVVTDVRMPVMCGTDMVRELRKSRPTMPVLFVSGNAESSAIAEFGNRTALLSKPFTHARLLAALDDVVLST